MELQAADHILPPFCCYSALALALRTIYRAPSARELALDLQAPASMGQAIALIVHQFLKVPVEKN